ncbi:MAG: hypothetical protein IJL20_05415 [Lachnospiraceae bacterium]|nr:hypothetical protein [Lachnospiraceae bacterium]
MQVIKWDEFEEISPVGLSSQNGLIAKRTSDMVMARTKRSTGCDRPVSKTE